MSDVVLVERSGTVATVLLNRPDQMNALNLAVWRGLEAVFTALNADDSIRAVVLRGAGTQVFAPGADIKEFDSDRATADQARAYDATMRAALQAVADCPHPTIAMIYGPCVGGGLELAAQCDLRISAASGRYGVPVGKISVTMGQPEIECLLQLCGPAKMLEILLEARIYTAEEALSYGLIHRVVADDALEGEIAATLKRITANAPLVNRWHKSFVRRAQQGAPYAQAELDLAYAFLKTADFAEGMAAFAAKRRPQFTGQ